MDWKIKKSILVSIITLIMGGILAPAAYAKGGETGRQISSSEQKSADSADSVERYPIRQISDDDSIYDDNYVEEESDDEISIDWNEDDNAQQSEHGSRSQLDSSDLENVLSYINDPASEKQFTMVNKKCRFVSETRKEKTLDLDDKAPQPEDNDKKKLDNLALVNVLLYMNDPKFVKRFILVNKKCNAAAQTLKINPFVSETAESKDYKFFSGIKTLVADFYDIQRIESKGTSRPQTSAYKQAQIIEYIRGTFTVEDFKARIEYLKGCLKADSKPLEKLKKVNVKVELISPIRVRVLLERLKEDESKTEVFDMSLNRNNDLEFQNFVLEMFNSMFWNKVPEGFNVIDKQAKFNERRFSNKYWESLVEKGILDENVYLPNIFNMQSIRDWKDNFFEGFLKNALGKVEYVKSKDKYTRWFTFDDGGITEYDKLVGNVLTLNLSNLIRIRDKKSKSWYIFKDGAQISSDKFIEYSSDNLIVIIDTNNKKCYYVFNQEPLGPIFTDCIGNVNDIKHVKKVIYKTIDDINFLKIKDKTNGKYYILENKKFLENDTIYTADINLLKIIDVYTKFWYCFEDGNFVKIEELCPMSISLMADITELKIADILDKYPSIKAIDLSLARIGTLDLAGTQNIRKIIIGSVDKIINVASQIKLSVINLDGLYSKAVRQYVKTVDLSNTKVKTIKSGAFQGNKQLKIVKLPKTIQHIAEDAFDSGVNFVIGDMMYSGYEELPDYLTQD